MEIDFKSKKMMKAFNSEKSLQREYGHEQARFIKNRMSVLSAAPKLADVPVEKPERRHELKGDKKNQFAVDLKQPSRLIFEPNHNPIPTAKDGGIDLKTITAIRILKIEKDYH